MNGIERWIVIGLLAFGFGCREQSSPINSEGEKAVFKALIASQTDDPVVQYVARMINVDAPLRDFVLDERVRPACFRENLKLYLLAFITPSMLDASFFFVLDESRGLALRISSNLENFNSSLKLRTFDEADRELVLDVFRSYFQYCFVFSEKFVWYYDQKAVDVGTIPDWLEKSDPHRTMQTRDDFHLEWDEGESMWRGRKPIIQEDGLYFYYVELSNLGVRQWNELVFAASEW